MNIIGLDIGGTKCSIVHLDQDGNLVEGKQIPTADFESTWRKLRKEIGEMDLGSSPVFGISYGGPVDTLRNEILPSQNLPEWERHSLAELLPENFGGEAYIMNDANAGALAEWIYGAARGYKNVIFLTFGTGLGAGIILENRLYEGTNGMAGEIGHIRMARQGPIGCGKEGSFEGFCSGGGLARLVKIKAGETGAEIDFNLGTDEEITARHIGRAAAKGDPAALEILAQSGKYLGAGLSILIDILNPQIIVIGSIYKRCQKFLEGPMREVLEKEALQASLRACRIVPSELGDSIGSYAAVAVALYRKGIISFKKDIPEIN